MAVRACRPSADGSRSVPAIDIASSDNGESVPPINIDMRCQMAERVPTIDMRCQMAESTDRRHALPDGGTCEDIYVQDMDDGIMAPEVE